jgi:hypothetical protein
MSSAVHYEKEAFFFFLLAAASDQSIVRRNATQQRLLQTISALKGFVRALERRLEGHFVPTRSCAPCSHFVPDTEVNVLSVDIQGSLAIKTRQYSGKRFIFYTTVLFWHGHRNNQNTNFYCLS